jgi:hypothetical protein
MPVSRRLVLVSIDDLQVAVAEGSFLENEGGPHSLALRRTRVDGLDVSLPPL